MIREAVSTTFTMLSVWIVLSLGWYLVEDRGPNRPKGATHLATATIMFYVAVLIWQVYSLLNMQWVADGHGSATEISPYWPLGVLTIAVAIIGVAWKVWLYRPRAPTWMWFTVIGLSGVIVASVLLFFRNQ